METQLPFFFRQCLSSGDNHADISKDLYTYVSYATQASVVKSRLREGHHLPGQADRGRYHYRRRNNNNNNRNNNNNNSNNNNNNNDNNNNFATRPLAAMPPPQHGDIPPEVSAMTIAPVPATPATPTPTMIPQPIPVINPLLAWRGGAALASASSVSVASAASFASVDTSLIPGFAPPAPWMGDIGVFDALMIHSWGSVVDEEEEKNRKEVEEEEESEDEEPAPPGE